MLHIPAQRTRAELRIVGRVDDELFCSLRQLTTQLLVGQTAVERRDLQVDDTGDVLFRQRLIEYNLIQTVEELRSERAVQKRLYLFLGLVRDLAVRADAVQQILAAKIRRQDDNRVLKVHGSALRVGNASVVQHLKQDVEHIGMRLFDLIKQNHAVGAAAHRLCQLATLLILKDSLRVEDIHLSAKAE